MKYFSIFDLPTTYQIDLNLLSERYQKLQKSVHPDQFAHGSDNQKLLAVQKSSEINDAYETLKNPLTRAEYMVAEHGFDVRHEQSTINDGTFLMQQMELREELEEVEHGADPENALEQFYQDVQQLLNEYSGTFESQFNAGLHEDAAQTVRKLRFIYKLNEEAQRLEDKLLDF